MRVCEFSIAVSVTHWILSPDGIATAACQGRSFCSLWEGSACMGFNNSQGTEDATCGSESSLPSFGYGGRRNLAQSLDIF